MAFHRNYQKYRLSWFCKSGLKNRLYLRGGISSECPRMYISRYSRLPITRTLANSNQNRFPLDFRHTFTVILPSVTRTLDNSNLPLTRTNFRFPSGHFPYNFTLDNSNHVSQYVTSQNKQCTVDQNIEFILKQPSINCLFVCFFVLHKTCTGYVWFRLIRILSKSMLENFQG